MAQPMITTTPVMNAAVLPAHRVTRSDRRSNDAPRAWVFCAMGPMIRSPRGFERRLRQTAVKPGNLEVHWPEGNILLSGGAIDPDSMEPDYNTVVTLEAI